MSTVPASPPPTRPAGELTGPAGVRPAGPAGTRPPARRGETVGPPAEGMLAPPGSKGDHIVAMTAAFVALFLEVESGRRPRTQLAPLMTPMLYARLSDIWITGGVPGHVVTVSLLCREPTHCDLVAVVRRGNRSGALSLRLLRVAGRRWLVDVVARPEDGCLPPPAYPVALDDGEDDEPVAIPVVARASGPPGADWFRPREPG